MQFLFEDDLVETAVGLAATGRLPGVLPEEMRSYHADRERCYRVADSDRRAEAFARVHLDWFGKWGLRTRLESAFSHFPELPAALFAMVFRRARGRHDEGAELYSDDAGRRRGVLALGPDRLLTRPMLDGFLHHELAHLEDMVSARFSYASKPDWNGTDASPERLVRDRYRLLWNVRIDGSLFRRGLAALADVDQRREEFGKAFGFLGDARRSELFEGLWTGSFTTHEELMRLAADPRNLRTSKNAAPGAPCPLCGFAAFRWRDATELRAEALARVRKEFPKWDPEEPICARCTEIYDAVTGIEYPSTVCV